MHDVSWISKLIQISYYFLSYIIYIVQSSADIEMINYKIKISFVSPEGACKFGINFRNFIFLFVENCLQCDSIYNFRQSQNVFKLWQKSSMWRLKNEWLSISFLRGFLSYFSSYLPYFYDVTWLIFETRSPATTTN